MSGELWRAISQIGKEVTPGTAVAATRKVYLDDLDLTPTRTPRPHKFQTGTRDNVRAFSHGPQMPGGKFKIPMSADEILEWLLVGVEGNVTPSTPAGGVYDWTFVPGSNDLDALTLQWLDGANPWHEAGVRANKLDWAGSAEKEHTLSVDLFGQLIEANALTTSLDERTPSIIEGFETSLFIDALGGTPGNTLVADQLINWNVSFDNALGRKYFANNSNSVGAITTGEMKLEAKLMFEAAAAGALDEFTNFDTTVGRLVRLEFGENTEIVTGYKKHVILDLPGFWSVVNLGQKDNATRVYEMTLQYVYDLTNVFGFRVIVRTDRATAW